MGSCDDAHAYEAELCQDPVARVELRRAAGREGLELCVHEIRLDQDALHTHTHNITLWDITLTDLRVFACFYCVQYGCFIVQGMLAWLIPDVPERVSDPYLSL
jgi:hypothetical protein